MKALLDKLAAEDDPDALAKEWRNQIRDVSYDVEDCVDDFLRRVDHGGGRPPPEVGFFHRSVSKIKALGARHDIAKRIRELNARVDDVSNRHSRYIFEGASSSSSSAAVVPVDTRLSALYATRGSLVSIDKPRDEVIALLAQGDSLKVVSIGGLGKTTLACEVFSVLGEQFDCQVIVPVSQSPDIIKILTKIIKGVKRQPPHICDARDQHELVEELRAFLHQKRYLIIIDDIWDPDVWDVIRHAFPDNSHGSRVITTTRVESVAARSCTYHHECVYKMRALDMEDSRMLFLGRIFGSEGACPNELKEVSTHILRKCGGLPLAIITIANSLLSSQESKVKEYWEYVQTSMGSNVGADRSLEVMRQTLNLSYKNLPPHLKTCFLYLGAYPEDSVIWRDDLVRQWVAEGFLGAVDVASNCVNELVNRSMIQPVELDYNGEVLSCAVHDMMLDLIIWKHSGEENFLTVVDQTREKIKGSSHNVRRLFHHSSAVARRREVQIPAAAAAVDIDLSKVRSLSVCGRPSHIVPRLSKLKFIRVLILEVLYAPDDEEKEEAIDLTAICKLFHLRYVKVRSYVELLLPAQIRALQHLETMEMVRLSRLGIALPSDIAQLPRLTWLSILPHMASLPDGVGAMRCPRSLAFFVLDERSLATIGGLRQLVGLRELYVRLPLDVEFEAAAEARVGALCASLPDPELGGGVKLYVNAWSHTAWFPGVPRWVGRLEKLYSLELGVGELSGEGVAVLAGLPALARLDLWLRGAPKESAVITGAGFPALKHIVTCSWALWLTFEAGAMPLLQRLKLEFNAEPDGGCSNVLAGVEHLSALEKIHASIGALGKGTAAVDEDSGRRAAAVSALRDAIGSHPNNPRVDIVCTQGRYGGLW